MRLNFKKVTLHNFMSFKDSEFDLSENRGLVLVSGNNLDVPDSKNAVGKSSLFSAILYCLFGELQYPIKNVNLKNRYVDDREMSVKVEFSVDEKHSYEVIRQLNKRNQSSLALKRIDNSTGKEEDLTKFSIAETDAFLQNEIIQCDISIFLRTIFLSSDQNYNFFKSTPAEKRNFIERLFNISVFGEMYSLIHKDILAMDKQLAVKQNVLITLNKNLEDCASHMETYMADRENKLLELAKNMADLEEARKKLSEEINSGNNDETNKIREQLSSLKEKKSILKEGLFKFQQKERKLSLNIAKMKSLVDSKKKIISEHKKLFEKLCKDCRPIAEDHYDIGNIQTEIAETEKQIKESNEKKTVFDEKISKATEKISEIENEYSELTSRLSELVEESNLKKLELQKIETSITSLSVNYDDMKSNENPYEEIMSENKEKIHQQNMELSEISERYRYLKFAENIVNTDTLKKFIIKDLVALLNVKIKYYLAKLGGNFECKFDENMDVSFLTPGGKCDYANFSSGEQMRLMIASCFAFKDFMQTRNNFSSNILILDEFIDSGIDDLAIGGVVKIFDEFKKLENQSIYVISHRIDDFENFPFDTLVKITKEKNISSFEIVSIK